MGIGTARSPERHPHPREAQRGTNGRRSSHLGSSSPVSLPVPQMRTPAWMSEGVSSTPRAHDRLGPGYTRGGPARPRTGRSGRAYKPGNGFVTVVPCVRPYEAALVREFRRTALKLRARLSQCPGSATLSRRSYRRQPVPAAVTACRYTLSARSPLANTPSTDVYVPFITFTYPPRPSRAGLEELRVRLVRSR